MFIVLKHVEKERKELIPEVFHSANSNTTSLKNLYLQCH